MTSDHSDHLICWQEVLQEGWALVGPCRGGAGKKGSGGIPVGGKGAKEAFVELPRPTRLVAMGSICAMITSYSSPLSFRAPCAGALSRGWD
jgi:hypothetical protein